MSRGILQRWWYGFCQLWCQWGLVLGYRYRVWGREHVPRRGGVLLVSNHQSFLDPVLVAAGLPRQVHYMARRSLFRVPGFRGLIRSLNAFPVRRGGVDLSAVRETVARLGAGELVLVFPEGTRTDDGRIQPLRRGVELLARRARVPIVPVVIDGAYEAWPRSRRWPRLGTIRVEFGRPIRWQEPGRSTERVGERLRSLQAGLRRRCGLGPGGAGGWR